MNRKRDTLPSLVAALQHMMDKPTEFKRGVPCRIERCDVSGTFWFYQPYQTVALLLTEFTFNAENRLPADSSSLNCISYYTKLHTVYQYSDQSETQLESDTIYFNKMRGSKKQLCFASGSFIQGITVFFVPEEIQKILFMQNVQIHDLLSITDTAAAPDISSAITLITAQMKNCQINNPVLADVYYKSKISELLSLLFNELSGRSNISSSSFLKKRSTHIREDDKKQIDALIDYLKSNIGNDISLTQLSRLTHMSKSKLTATFKRATGFTVMEYRNHLLMGKATELLKDEKNSIKDVAASCGFHRMDSFTNFFRRQTGLSPRQYRIKQLSAGHQ